MNEPEETRVVGSATRGVDPDLLRMASGLRAVGFLEAAFVLWVVLAVVGRAQGILSRTMFDAVVPSAPASGFFLGIQVGWYFVTLALGVGLFLLQTWALRLYRVFLALAALGMLAVLALVFFKNVRLNTAHMLGLGSGIVWLVASIRIVWSEGALFACEHFDRRRLRGEVGWSFFKSPYFFIVGASLAGSAVFS